MARQSLTATVRKDRESTTETYTAVSLGRQIWHFLSSLSREAMRDAKISVPAVKRCGKDEKSEVRAHSVEW